MFTSGGSRKVVTRKRVRVKRGGTQCATSAYEVFFSNMSLKSNVELKILPSNLTK